MFNFVRDQGRGIHVVFRGLKFEPDADIGQIRVDFERGRFEIGSIDH
jgi:hypothetical protein